ncbi:MAG: pilus assembly protein MshP [Gammaproteobacteria bacterium]|nr:pilus assembly protein MshP [Gammaproteobacteria bacterium]
MIESQINKKNSQGFTLVAVIFVITVLAVAVVFLQRISNVSVATNVLAMQGARAMQAASAGAEWGIYQATQGSCVGSTTFSLTEASLKGFTVKVDCDSQLYTEQSVPVTMYFLTVFAEYGTLGTTPEYASRKITLTVES